MLLLKTGESEYEKIISVFIFFTVFFIQQISFAAVQQTERNDETRKEPVVENNLDEVKVPEIETPELSQIEKLYNDEDNIKNGNIIEQIGYNFVNSQSGGTSGKFDNSYKLNIGERVKVDLYGESVDVVTLSGSKLLTPSSIAEVDTKGNVFIPGLGSFPAEGRTIGQVEASANSVASSKFNSLSVKISIESGTQIPVFVYGKVERSGKILVGSNSTVYDVLAAAGGVTKQGTLRNIYLSSGTRAKTIDLYSLFFNSTGNVTFVKANDKIYVSEIGSTVALKNGVNVPGIYEIKPGETIQNVIKYAGGLLTGTTTEDVILTGLDSVTKQRTAKNVSWNELKLTTLKSGDAISFRESYNTAENTVTLQGNIKHPATYAYKNGMRLSDILKNEGELLEETFISQASVRRISGKDNTVETIPVSLKDLFEGKKDPLLQPRDVITVYKNTNTGFIEVYGCINTPKHLVYKPDMTLKDIMTDLKFVESEYVNVSKDDNLSAGDETLKNEFPVAYQIGVEENAVNRAVDSVPEIKSKIIPSDNIAVEIISENEETQIYYLYDIMLNSNKISTIMLNPDDKVFFRTLRSNEVLKTVKVSGFVKNPGVFTFVEGKHLKDMIEAAGGLTDDAQLEGIVFSRPQVKDKQVKFAQENSERDIKLLQGRIASGYMQSNASVNQKETVIEQLKENSDSIDKRYNGQIALNIKSNDLSKISDVDNILIQDGDDIYVPKVADYVSVIGEVYNEQSFSYQKGKNAKHYIKQVGGYTPNANKFRLYKVGVNGRAVKIGGGTKISQGDVIIVPRKISGNDWLQPVTNVLQSFMSIFMMAFVVKKW